MNILRLVIVLLIVFCFVACSSNMMIVSTPDSYLFTANATGESWENIGLETKFSGNMKIELYESDGKQIVFRIEEGGRTKISVQIEGKILDKASISGQLNLA